MKKILILLAALGLAAPAPALAQQAAVAKVLSSCGSATYSAGSSQAITQDTTGVQCTSAGGGGGGNVNLTGINGVTPLVGAGATGTGSLRTTQAQDTSTVAGAAPLTTGIYVTGPSAAALSTSGNQTNVQSAPGTPQTTAVTIQGNASGVAVPTTSSPGARTIVALDIATVTTGGIAVTALNAGHRTAGGFLQNPIGATINLCINEQGAASGTTSAGATTCIQPGQSYSLTPAAAAVSVITSDSSHPYSGYGLN